MLWVDGLSNCQSTSGAQDKPAVCCHELVLGTPDIYLALAGTGQDNIFVSQNNSCMHLCIRFTQAVNHCPFMQWQILVCATWEATSALAWVTCCWWLSDPSSICWQAGRPAAPSTMPPWPACAWHPSASLTPPPLAASSTDLLRLVLLPCLQVECDKPVPGTHQLILIAPPVAASSPGLARSVLLQSYTLASCILAYPFRRLYSQQTCQC